MATNKGKRAEAKGGGFCKLEGQGYEYIKINSKEIHNPLFFVEREPDNLLAAAIICNRYKGDFHIQFTDRHSINYDLTKFPLEVKHDGILIFCPSIDSYSILFLDRLDVPYLYVGSTTKLNSDTESFSVVNENIHLTKAPVCRLLMEKLNLHADYISEVIAYTEKYIPEDLSLISVIRYQYINFKYSAKEMFELFVKTVAKGQLAINEEQEKWLQDKFLPHEAACEKALDNVVVRVADGKKYAFIQGGCPCTLGLNVAIRKHQEWDVVVNVCTHRQHFTVLTRDNVEPVYEAHMKNFIYTGFGSNSAGGCFGKKFDFDEIVDAFFTGEKAHGFADDRKINYTAFDPEDYEWLAEIYDIQGKRVYKNFNFTIFLDNYCNADCKFCVEQIKTANTGKIEKTRIAEKEVYVERLDEVLQKIRPLNPSISVTGGEPLLSPWFDDVMKLLGKYRFRKTVITTNGTDIKKHMDAIIEAGISHVNFSRPHMDERIVQNIMRFGCDHHMTTYDEFPEIIDYLEKNRVRTRFNCIMSREGISSVEDMKKYLDFIRSLGCHHVVFRELMSFNEATAANLEKKKYADENRVLINERWEIIDRDKAFIPMVNMQGHYYYIEIYQYKDMTMVSERANLSMLETEQRLNEQYLYEMVFHPNGNLCAGWTEDKEVLDGK